jgi:hypothetical protein
MPSLLSVIGSVIILTSAIYVAVSHQSLCLSASMKYLMGIQLTKTNTPSKSQNKGITLEGAEEAGMEQGLLGCMDSGELDESHIQFNAKTKGNHTTAVSAGQDDAERGCASKAAEIPEDLRDIKMGT